MGMWDERAGWVSAAEHTERLSGLLDNLPDPETQEQAGHLERLRQIVAALEAPPGTASRPWWQTRR